jgi:hypothetical protein
MPKTYAIFGLLAIALAGLYAVPASADTVTVYETRTTTVAPVDPNYSAPLAAEAAPQNSAPMAGSATADAQLQPTHQGNITYITGGIGEEERNELDAAKKDYNLHITNADKTGAFTGDTHIAILDHDGNQLVNVAVGPIFLASLPAGQYRIEATDGSQTKKQTIAVGRTKPVSIHMAW